MSFRQKPIQSYLVNPWVDWACVGVISIAVMLFFRFYYSSYGQYQVSDSALSSAAMFAWLLNWPHFYASSELLYKTPHSQTSKIFLPFTVVAGAIACFLFPTTFAPYFIKLSIVWSLFHYGRQALGFTLIYARRHNLNFGLLEKRALDVFLIACSLYTLAILETFGDYYFFSVRVPSLGFPSWIPTALFCTIHIFGIPLLSYFCWKLFRATNQPALIVVLPLLSHYLWFVASVEVFSFQTLVPAFHGLQYLLIAWIAARDSGRCNNVYKWGLTHLVGGALLYAVLPWVISLFGIESTFANAVVISTVQIHHFAVDGVIWKNGGKALFQKSAPAHTSESLAA